MWSANEVVNNQMLHCGRTVLHPSWWPGAVSPKLKESLIEPTTAPGHQLGRMQLILATAFKPKRLALKIRSLLVSFLVNAITLCGLMLSSALSVSIKNWSFVFDHKLLTWGVNSLLL